MLFLLNLPSFGNWLSEVGDKIMGTLDTGLRSLYYSIITVVYWLIGTVYNLFDKLCKARLLDNDVLGEMSKRIGYILGLIMLFYIIFSFIQMLIDPDKISNKENGASSIIKKSILVIVMLGMANPFFQMLQSLQNEIIETDALSKLILPFSVVEEDKQNFGNLLSVNLLEAFYHVEDLSQYDIIDNEANEKKDGCKYVVQSLYDQILKKNKYDIGRVCLNTSVKVNRNVATVDGDESLEDEIYLVNFNGIIAIAAGAFTVYILLMYCFKVGVRIIQLTFLEIISPMAIISHLSPKKDNMFSTWTKMYFTTYIDVFIRIAIINFVVFLICTIFSSDTPFSVFFNTVNPSGWQEEAFFTVVIVLALLTFAKKAPDLLGKLFPSSVGSLGYGISMKDIEGLQKVTKVGASVVGGTLGRSAIGLIAGWGSGKGLHRLTGAIGGVTLGAVKGGLSGLKGEGFMKTASSQAKAQGEYAKKLADIRANGGSWLGYQTTQMREKLHLRTAAENYNLEKGDLEAENSLYNQLASYYEAAKSRAKGKIEDGDFDLAKTFNGNQVAYDAAIAALKQKQKITLLQSTAANIDVSTTAGRARLAALNDEIARETHLYNDTLETAISHYMNDGTDAVIIQNMDLGRKLVEENPKLREVTKNPITNFKTFKGANDLAKAEIATNNIKLNKNAAKGKKARANAGK